MFTEEGLKRYILNRIEEYKQKRDEMRVGIDYYNGDHDIMRKTRLAIGAGGSPVIVENLPNSRIKDNQYKKAVDQKVNYLFSHLPTIKETEGGGLADKLIEMMDKRFLRTLNKIARDAFNASIAWLYVYTDGKDMKYKRIDPLEVIPIWKDANHESLEAVIHTTQRAEYKTDGTREKVEEISFYTDDGVTIYEKGKNGLHKVGSRGYIEDGEQWYAFDRIPFVYFKLPTERPLIFEVKSLQDALNTMLSNFADNMLEDPRNTLLVIKNYDGQDLGELRQYIMKYGAIKVEEDQNVKGGVETLEIKVNHQNYEAILSMIKKSLKDNTRTVDLENDKGSNPNILNIQSLYSMMELDANQMELEFTASFEYLYHFMRQVYGVTGDADLTFRRNIMVNEESKIDLVSRSIGYVSNRTALANHPWVDDVDEEISQIDEEKSKRVDGYYNPFEGVGDDERDGSDGVSPQDRGRYRR